MQSILCVQRCGQDPPRESRYQAYIACSAQKAVRSAEADMATLFTCPFGFGAAPAVSERVHSRFALQLSVPSNEFSSYQESHLHSFQNSRRLRVPTPWMSACVPAAWLLFPLYLQYQLTAKSMLELNCLKRWLSNLTCS
jgi:hypothetical protein